MSETLVVAAASNPATAPVVIPTYVVVKLIEQLVLLQIAKATAALAAREAAAATTTAVSAPFPVVGWIIGGVAVAATAVSIVALVDTIDKLNTIKSLVKSGRFEEAMSKMDSDARSKTLQNFANNLVSYPEYRQSDSAWSSYILSSSGETMRQIGCYITSMASALDHAGCKLGSSRVDPGNLAAYLKNKNYIGSDGCLKWDVFRDFGFTQESSTSFSFDRVVNSMAQGSIVVVKVGGHFMLARGIDSDGDIKVMDPAGQVSYVKTNRVDSLRVFKRS